MLELSMGARSALEVVCIGAHCDDIEIGCGGTLSELAILYPESRFHCWVFSGDEIRRDESRICLEQLLGGSERLNFRALEHTDSSLPAEWLQVKTTLHDLAGQVSPDVVFSHATTDFHQDHRLLAELTWNAFRNQLILEYEILKYDGDLGRPNVYFPLRKSTLTAKVSALMQSFASQHDKSWFRNDTFESLARIRGVECKSDSGFAEAFTARKVVLGVRH